LNKIPDVLLDRHAGLVWVEVENSWRSDKDLAKVVASMRATVADGRVAEVHFVITAPGGKTMGERLSKALTHRLGSGWSRHVRELDARILAQDLKVFALNSDSLELSPVAF
jgi:hypothetical protein